MASAIPYTRCKREGLALILGLGSSELRDTGLEYVSDSIQQGTALGRCLGRPRGEGSTRSSDGVVDVECRGIGELAVDLAGGRLIDWQELAAG